MSEWPITPEEEEAQEKLKKREERIRLVAAFALGVSLILTNISHIKSFDTWVHILCAIVQMFTFGILFFKLENIEKRLLPLGAWYFNKYRPKNWTNYVSVATYVKGYLIVTLVLGFFYGVYFLIIFVIKKVLID